MLVREQILTENNKLIITTAAYAKNFYFCPSKVHFSSFTDGRAKYTKRSLFVSGVDNGQFSKQTRVTSNNAHGKNWVVLICLLDAWLYFRNKQVSVRAFL